MENGFFKGIMFIVLLLYIVSPIDLMPGCPIDDLLLLMIALCSNKRALE